jgi:SAM-dependent methyltransferase
MSDYRESHSQSGYGKIYRKTYVSGYYAAQWQKIERPLLQRVFEELRTGGSRSYLDFACGTGRILQVGEGIFPHSAGVDISEDMAHHAREICKESVVHAPRDITRHPLDGSFDVISAFRFFLNAQPDLRRDVLNAMARMQTPGGVLVCNTHVNSSSIVGFAYRFRNWVTGTHTAATLGALEFTKILNDAGYDVSKTYAYSYWPRMGNRMPGFQEKAVVAVERLQQVTGVLPRGMAQSILLVCRKR